MHNEERSLAGDTTDLGTDPGTGPTEPDAVASPFGTPNATVPDPPPVSIIDTILDLDSFMSGDVRRAEKTARFCSKPWLEADIDELIFELDALTDEQGNPIPGQEKAAHAVAVKIQTKQAAYGAAFVSVRMAQLSSDDWKAFRTKWREALDKPGEKPNELYNELIEVSAKTPPITAVQAAHLRTKLGDPQMDTLASAAWDVNTNSGVSIPKSPLSSHVLRQAARAQS